MIVDQRGIRMTNVFRCDHCKGKLTGFNNWENNIGDLVLCTKCYDLLKPFSVVTKYASIEELEEAKGLLHIALRDQGYSENQIEKTDYHFKKAQKKLEGASDVPDGDNSYQIFMKDVERGEYEEAITQHLETSGYNYEGHRILKYCGVVTGEIILGGGFFSGFSAGFADMFGMESEVYRNKLREARAVAMERMILESIFKGGNAVIGVDIDFILLNSSIIGVIANGTSVLIEEI